MLLAPYQQCLSRSRCCSRSKVRGPLPSAQPSMPCADAECTMRTREASQFKRSLAWPHVAFCRAVNVWRGCPAAPVGRNCPGAVLVAVSRSHRCAGEAGKVAQGRSHIESTSSWQGMDRQQGTGVSAAGACQKASFSS